MDLVFLWLTSLLSDDPIDTLAILLLDGEESILVYVAVVDICY
jgi:hypothetical protein